MEGPEKGVGQEALGGIAGDMEIGDRRDGGNGGQGRGSGKGPHKSEKQADGKIVICTMRGWKLRVGFCQDNLRHWVANRRKQQRAWFGVPEGTSPQC